MNWLLLDHLIKYYERDELMKELVNLQVKMRRNVKSIIFRRLENGTDH